MKSNFLDVYRFVLIACIVVVFHFLTPHSYAIQPVQGSWTLVNTILAEDIIVDPNNSDTFYAAKVDGLYRSIDGGSTWILIYSGTGIAKVAVAPSDSNTIYIGGYGYSPILKSVDGGTSWINVTNGLPITNNGGSYPALHRIMIHPTNPDNVYLGLTTACSGLWSTSNGGTTWDSHGLNCDTQALDISYLNPNVIYVGGGGPMPAGSRVYKTTDGGIHWIDTNGSALNNLFGYGIGVTALAIDPNNPSIIYAGSDSSPGVYKSNDSGATWTLVSSVGVFRNLIIDPVRPETIYFASFLTPNIYMSNDGGLTSINITNNFPNVLVRKIIIPQNNPNTLYAATSGGLYVYGLEPSGLSLPVPLFKQGILPFNDNNPLWEGQEFDHANAGQFYCGTTMAQCGCATTSVAMFLNYFGVIKLPGGETLDPGTLDTWLKNNHGYNRNKGITWGVAATVARKAKSLNPDFQYSSLEVDDDWTYNPTKLSNDLENEIPNVLQVGTQLNPHFVVATGIDSNDKFTINDPFYERTSLSDYGDTAASVRRFVPANSDMSYISLAIDEGVTIEVKDQNGNIVGNTYLDYGPGNPIEDSSQPQPLPLKIFEYAKPDTGAYTIEISTLVTKDFQLDITLITQDGDIKTETVKGIVGSSTPEIFTLSFNKQSTIESEVQKNVTFESTLDDIKELRQQRLLHFSTALAMTALIKNAENLHEKGKDMQAEKLIDVAIKLVIKSPERFVYPVAEEILLYDLNKLKDQLSN